MPYLIGSLNTRFENTAHAMSSLQNNVRLANTEEVMWVQREKGDEEAAI